MKKKVLGIKSSKKYLWKSRGIEVTVKEASGIISKELGEFFSPEKLRYRLKMTDYNFDKVINFYPEKKPRKVTTFECPDGVRRTKSEIATHLGVSYSWWRIRFSQFGMKKAWNMILNAPPKAEKTKTNSGPKVPTKKELDDAKELKRVEKLLNKIPAPTSFEESLYS